MKISITLETVDESILYRVFEAQANGDEDELDAVWEDAQDAVIEAIRAEFSPGMLVHVID